MSHRLCVGVALLLCLSGTGQGADRLLRAGAAFVEISPTNYPVLVNGMFTERTASTTIDPLTVRAIVLDNGELQIALAVVDTCMIPRDLIDSAKRDAARATGIAAERMLVSATHTHSAPAAMGCLGSRADTNYAAFLPGRIAAAILQANERLRPARIGWAVVDDWDHTFNRRWIRRPDRMFEDPFGERTVRAHMHPGHESADVTGPSGPVDPALSMIALESADGKPMALLANYSQHYYDSPLLSSDYFGKFAVHISNLLGANDANTGFVGIISQGTSGDLARMDYGAPPRKEIGYDAYARELAERAHSAYKGIQFTNWIPLKNAQTTLRLKYRVPTEKRLAWAKQKAADLGARLPKELPEVYALEAIYLNEKRETELVLQALRIGEVGIAAIPNEVYALTGLKLKAQSPLQPCINISLANGAEGYIPPPEQHKLGGYTTWPARTAGLEVEAEPRIVETLLGLLESIAEKPRRTAEPAPGKYTQIVHSARPTAYWRLEEMALPSARDASGNRNHAIIEDGVAVYLPGVGSGSGFSPKPQLTNSEFSEAKAINRAYHFAGGRIRSTIAALGTTYTAEMWFWNGLPNNVRPVAGYMFSRGKNEDPEANGDHLGIGGTHQEGLVGRLIFFNGNKHGEVLSGKAPVSPKTWHHLALVRDQEKVSVYLNGELDLQGTMKTSSSEESEIFVGGRSDNFANFEGKLDEVALYDRTLSAAEVKAHFAAGQGATSRTNRSTATLPLSPEESLKRIHVSPGFEAELMAAEPHVLDPVAIDWDADGRMWVVEMADYPLGLDGNGKPGGRVRILEDTDGDGRYDKSILFAEGLRFPTGILTWRDGVLVTAAPDILFLRDADGDGKASSVEEKRVLFTGFSEGNQQLRVNGLRWGFDNWVYCAMGAHFRGYADGTKIKSAQTGKEIVIGSMDFRFRPDSGEIEPQAGPSQFGRNRDDFGRWFGSQNSRPLWHYILPHEYLLRNPHVPAPDPVQQVMIPLNPKVYPVSPSEKRFHSFEQAGHFTSGCSGMIYRDTLLFSENEGIQGFASEPFHNLVHREILSESGVSFTAKRAIEEQRSEFFASEDRWCRPVMTLTGPDGAFWVVDMYRYMIEHPDWLPENGKAELLPHYREGEDKGRIYRVVRKGVSPRNPKRLGVLTDAELVAAMDSPNGWQRDKAQQMILWREARSVEAQLRQVVGQSPTPGARVQALWTLRHLGLVNTQDVVRALGDAHPGVRENGLRIAENVPSSEVTSSACRLVGDPSPKVRMQLAFTLGEWNERSAGKALAELAIKDHADPFMVAAIMSSAVPHLESLVARLGSAGPASKTFTEPLQMLAFALNRRDLLARLLEPMVPNNVEQVSVEQLNAYGAFLKLLQRQKTTPKHLQDAQRNDALDQLLSRGTKMLNYAKQAATNSETSGAFRLAAATLLTRDPDQQNAGLETLSHWIAPQFPIDVQRGALAALGDSGDSSVPTLLLNRWDETTPEIRSAMTEILLRRELWGWALLQRVSAGDIPANGFDAVQRARFKEHESKRIRELASTVFTSKSKRSEVIDSYRPSLQLRGDASRGAGVFVQLCQSCHRQNGQGNEIGPDLRSVAGHSAEKLLFNILDPSADVQPGFHAYLCILNSGEELYGIITAETPVNLVLRLVDNSTRNILRNEIASLRSSGRSLMPDGLENGLTSESLADLIAFLKSQSP